MKSNECVFMFLLLSSGCSQKAGNQSDVQTAPTAVETSTADEASLRAGSRAAEVSDAEALAAKAPVDKLYDETSARMDQTETERIARMKQLKHESCAADCPDQ